MNRPLIAALAFAGATLALPTLAQTAAPPCPTANLLYWQAFPPGGESDLSARHQQIVLKKKCPAIETVIQYKAGAGGGLMWSQMNTLPADGLNIVGVNLPHIVLQPMEGKVSVQDRGRHAGVLVPLHAGHPGRRRAEPDQELGRLRQGGQGRPGQDQPRRLGAQLGQPRRTRADGPAFGIKTTYVPYKGTGDLSLAVLGGHIEGAMTYTPFAINNKGKVRRARGGDGASAIRCCPMCRPSRSSASTGSTAPTAASACRSRRRPKQRKRLSDLLAALNDDPEMKELAAKSGFELVNVGVDGMDGFMKERTRVYIDAGKRMGLGGAK